MPLKVRWMPMRVRLCGFRQWTGMQRCGAYPNPNPRFDLTLINDRRVFRTNDQPDFSKIAWD